MQKYDKTPTLTLSFITYTFQETKKWACITKYCHNYAFSYSYGSTIGDTTAITMLKKVVMAVVSLQ